MVETLQEVLKLYQSAQGVKGADGEYLITPGDALTAFDRDFGDDLLQLAISSSSENVGGAAPSEATLADAKAYDHVIRDLAPILGDEVGMLDMVVNNSNGASLDYSDEALRYQKLTNIPGVNKLWRATLTGAESTVSREVADGWAKFSAFQDGIDAKMFAANIKSTSTTAGQPLADAKNVWLVNMSQSNPAWYAEYMNGAPARTQKAVTTLTRMTSDPAVTERMMAQGQEGLLRAMNEYLYYRQQTAIALEENKDDAAAKDQINVAWDTIRTNLKQSDVRWADIQTRWLDNDANPQYAGEPIITAAIG
jgi:hypothetical protein